MRLATDGLSGIGTAFLGSLMLLGSLFERAARHRAGNKPPGPGWERTTERFRDPGTGQVIVAWLNALTGQRSYMRVGGNRMPLPPRCPVP